MTRTKKDILENVDKPVKSSRKVAKNSVEIYYEDGTRAIRLHDTDVVTFDGEKIIFNSGGWRTNTTKERMSQFSPFFMRQEDGVWYINGHYYYDGITLDHQGNLLSETREPDFAYIKKVKKQINGYVRLITEDNLPLPDAGDCWLCALQDQDGNTIGENDTDHLWSHIEEGYVHGWILVNAMREKGYGDEQIRTHYALKIVDTFRRAVRRYLQKRLLPEMAAK